MRPTNSPGIIVRETSLTMRLEPSGVTTSTEQPTQLSETPSANERARTPCSENCSATGPSVRVSVSVKGVQSRIRRPLMKVPLALCRSRTW